MCLIYFRTEKTKKAPNWDAIERGFYDNPDSWGFAGWVGGKWHIVRNVSIHPDFNELRTLVDKIGATRWAVHFRWATHGKINESNCHPFSIGNGGYLMHNGILSIKPRKVDTSDTWEFARLVRTIGVDKIGDCLPLLATATHGSRILYLMPDGKLLRTGDWKQYSDGCYSNSNCMFVPKKYVQRGTVFSDDLEWDNEEEKWFLRDR